MTRINRFRQRIFLLLATTLLVLALALVGCGANVAAQGSANTNSLAPAQSQTGAAGGPSQLQNDDHQVQSIMRSLNSALNDVNASDAAASQDSGQMP
jgi:Spy/CpxP family protein refolding chaperone